MILTLIFIATFLFSSVQTTIHDYSIQALNSNNEIDLASFQGRKILIVNVASKCGYTPQYEALQQLSELYRDKLTVIGFPCDQFLGQELNSEVEIQAFCTNEFQVTFPMTTMVEVKGNNQHPIYQWLTSKELNGKGDYKVSWNFNKFLIDENGDLIAHFPSKVKPMDNDIVKYLE